MGVPTMEHLQLRFLLKCDVTAGFCLVGIKRHCAEGSSAVIFVEEWLTIKLT